jgi:hypothetical protein
VTVGLPGAGIGGMFYLLAALLAPLWEAIRALRKNESPRQWQLVLRLFLLAGLILSGMWVTAWVIGVILTSPSIVREHVGVPVDPAYPQVIARSMALFALTTLTVVLVAVEVLRLSRLVLNDGGRHTVLPECRRPPSRSHCDRFGEPRPPTPIPAPHIAPADDLA